ncbi:MAG: hypothetical protein ACQER9_02405 [Nanobdellota archaeon]
MAQPKVIEEKPVDIYQVLSELKKIEKKDEELGFRSMRTKEYIEETKQLSEKKAKEIRDSIVALNIPRMKEEAISKIIDINPVSVQDLKQLINTFNVAIKDEYIKQIFDILNK